MNFSTRWDDRELEQGLVRYRELKITSVESLSCRDWKISNLRGLWLWKRSPKIAEEVQSKPHRPSKEENHKYIWSLEEEKSRWVWNCDSMSVPAAEFGSVNQCLSLQKNNDQYLTYVLVKIERQVGRIGFRTDSQTIPRSHSLRSCCRVYLLRQEKES